MKYCGETFIEINSMFTMLIMNVHFYEIPINQRRMSQRIFYTIVDD